MKLEVITMTGADNSIDPIELVKVSEKYPFIEWGILLSKSQVGNKRFPSKEWMEELNKYADKLILAGHLCGSWLRNLMDSGDVSFKDEIPIWNEIRRIQLNFHGKKTELTSSALNALRNLTWHERKRFIIQMDNINNKLCEQLIFSGVLTNGLFDLSHGTGILPSEWPKVIPSINPKAYRGYAGGLSPTNIKEQLHKIEESVGDCTIWIDMETHIRSNNDMLFDLNKVEACAEICKSWV